MTQFTLGLTGAFGHGRAFSEASPVPSPAAGNGFSIKIDSKYWERIASLSFQLTTSSTTANRQVTLNVKDGTGMQLAAFPAASVQAASLVYQYTFLPTVSTFSTVVGLNVLSPAPAFFLQPEWTLNVTVGTIDTTDAIVNIRYNRERFVTGPGGYQQGTVTDLEYFELMRARFAELLT